MEISGPAESSVICSKKDRRRLTHALLIAIKEISSQGNQEEMVKN